MTNSKNQTNTPILSSALAAWEGAGELNRSGDTLAFFAMSKVIDETIQLKLETGELKSVSFRSWSKMATSASKGMFFRGLMEEHAGTAKPAAYVETRLRKIIKSLVGMPQGLKPSMIIKDKKAFIRLPLSAIVQRDDKGGLTPYNKTALAQACEVFKKKEGVLLATVTEVNGKDFANIKTLSQSALLAQWQKLAEESGAAITKAKRETKGSQNQTSQGAQSQGQDLSPEEGKQVFNRAIIFLRDMLKTNAKEGEAILAFTRSELLILKKLHKELGERLALESEGEA
jgi:hypothetical protein